MSQYNNPYNNPYPTTPPQQTVQTPQYTVEEPKAKPVLTYLLLVVTILIFGAQYLSQTLYGGDFPAAFGAKINSSIMQGELWRLLTPAFLHGSVMHLAANMYALLVLGPGLERYYGHLRFAMLYFCGALTGNVASFLFSPNASLGASTAIFGLIVAQGIFVLQNKKFFGNRATRMILNIAFVVLINLGISLAPGIDMWGHIGGFVGGAVFAALAGPVLEMEQVYPSIRIQNTRSLASAWLTTVLISAGNMVPVMLLLMTQ